MVFLIEEQIKHSGCTGGETKTRTTERVSVLHILLLSKQFNYNLARPRVLTGRRWNLFLHYSLGSLLG